MTIEKTLSIIKPDGISKNILGEIIKRFEKNGLKIVAIKMIHLSRLQAEQFYAEHRERTFFSSLVEFMCSGPILVQVLEGENAINKNRQIMGATDPRQAQQGTIRADFADSVEANIVHGSDSLEAALKEIDYFFKGEKLYSR